MALTPKVTQELYQGAPLGHGGEPMGSLMKYLYPELSQPEAAEDYGVLDFHGAKIGGINGLDFEGSEILLPLNMSDVAPPSGSMSEPALASIERGRRIAEESAGKLARFVAWWKQVDPRAPEVTR